MILISFEEVIIYALIALAILSTVLLLGMGACGIWFKGISTRLYAFLMNRAAADLLFCLAYLYVTVCTSRGRCPLELHFTRVLEFGFAVSLVTTVGLSMLKLWAVTFPITYRQTIGLRHCLVALAVFWVAMAAAMTTRMIMTSKVTLAMRMHANRTSATLYLIMYIANIVMGVALLIVVCIRISATTTGGGRRNRSARGCTGSMKSWKRLPTFAIIVGVVTFALCYLPYIAMETVTYYFVKFFYTEIYNKDDKKWLYVMAKIGCLLRPTIDALLPVLIDHELTKTVLSKTRTSSSSRNSSQPISGKISIPLLPSSQNKNFATSVASQ